MNKLLDPSEQQIVRGIMELLIMRGISYVHVRTTGTLIQRDGRTFFGRAKLNQNGAPDIIFAYRGKPVACEVKSRTGKVRPEQTDWLKKWESLPSSGYGFVARSIQDVINALEYLDKLNG